MRSQAGHTLIELMVVCVLLVLLSTGAFAVLVPMFQGQRAAAGYTRDLQEAARVLEVLQADLIQSHGVAGQAGGGRWTLRGAGGTLEYRLSQGRLLRIEGSRSRVLAQRIDNLALRVRDGVCEITLGLRPRRRPAAPAQLFAASALAEELR